MKRTLLLYLFTVITLITSAQNIGGEIKRNTIGDNTIRESNKASIATSYANGQCHRDG